MVICYDNWFPEIARILALRGADVILMPHTARERGWDDTPESEAAARRYILDYFTSCYTMRARENACFCVFTDQAGRAGYVATYPRDHHNQPHHPGAAIFFGPDGSVLKSTQTERIQDEMIVQDLDPELLAGPRSHPNYTLRNRRPELFGELVLNQVSS
jgi:predicted amidohydrolase